MLDRVSDLIREVAADIVLPRFRHLSADEVQQKGPGDLVTIADQESERALARGLVALLPGSQVVGEEAVAADQSELDRLARGGDVWIVDPVDGTNNFAAGKTPFAIMVALVRAGEPVASWVYEPVTDVMTLAEAGSGAYRNGVRVKTSQENPGLGALRGIVAGKYLPPELRALALANASVLGEVTGGQHCAGYEYATLAADEQHFAMFWRILPWDHVPGSFIVSEAGGAVRHLDGTAYQPADSERGLLVAANEDVWRLVRDTLFPGRDV